MTQHPEAIFQEIASRIKGQIVSEVYARVAHIPMLAHYTSVDNFKSMLRSREFWLSLVRDTNDTSEVVEGARIVAEALEEHGPKIFINFVEFDTRRQFEAKRNLLETDTHVLSLCEHGNDQRTDRLVMWQAYGHNGHGICLVLRKDTLLGQTAKGRFPVHWCPIEYDNAAGLRNRVHRRLRHIQEAISATPNAQTLIPAPAFGMLVAGSVVQLVLGHKNVAFDHEKEIRFVRSRLLQDLAPPDGAVYRDVLIDGNPKSKFVVPLRNYPEFSIDASLPALLDHIIIGPSYQ